MRLNILVILCLSIIACTSRESYVIRSYRIINPITLSYEELDYIVTTLKLKGYFLIDLRSSEDYQQNHIKGAESHPYPIVENQYEQWSNSSQKIIFYDKGYVSLIKKNKIRKKLSNTQVYFLEKGIIKLSDTKLYSSYTNLGEQDI